MRRRGDAVDGVMLLDKPLGLSSNRALQTVRRLLNAQKAGHTGTLDPLATGLLPLCFGNATKFSADLLHADKRYEARVMLGVETATGDAEGEVTAKADASHLTFADLEAVLGRFRGEIEQIPPMYSALKRDGECLYEIARRGETVEREPRRVTIHELSVSDWESTEDGVFFTMKTLVSKGTYIRVLAEDIGRALGVGAHLRTLRRTRFYDQTAADDITGSVQDVLDERFREMGSLWRFFDIKRLNGAENAGISITREILSDPTDINTRTTMGVAPDDPRWAWPLYRYEAERMGWEQNAGWE